MSEEHEWWQEAVVYQIYPRSFNDSDGDGIGDIPGIVEKLDYLDELGVDVVWLNPVYESPGVDNGYDISDYRSIQPEYGTMDDWRDLLSGLHDREIRLIMDLVVNHTSDQHEWFQRSRRGDPDYEDYYVWREGDPAEPPNNWTSGFGGPAWSYDEERGAWYLHLFDETQPDLNWRNPDVREDIWDMMHFWLAEGIDGFRMDVINLLSKPREFPDGDPEAGWVGEEHFMDGPRIHEYLREMYDEVLAEYDVMTVGEALNVDVDTAAEYLLPDGDGLSMVFQFDHVLLDFHGEEGWWEVDDWTLPELRASFTEWQEGLAGRGWNSLYLGNHDWPRMVSRFGDDGQYRVESAKLLATFLLTLQGTPFVFQGDEIGMTNYPFESLDELRDADARNRVSRKLEAGEIDGFDDVKELIRYRCRDNARTPMQWADEPNAGFTDGEPWISVNPNYPAVNVADARADEDSVWHYVRRLIDLRHRKPVFVAGEYDLLLPDHPSVYAYRRVGDEATLLVLLNFDDSESACSLPTSVETDDATRLIGNYDDRPLSREPTLRPYEARLYERQTR